MKILTNKHFRRLAALLAADGLFFSLTNSTSVPSILIIAGFLLLMATLYQLIYAVMGLLRVYGLPIKQKRRVTAYMTAIIGFLVALQSIGELASKDILVLAPLAAIGYMYNAYAKNTRRLV